jgi:hypothetical protein
MATSRACSLARPCGSWRWSFGCLGGGVCWLILIPEAVGGWLSRVAGVGGWAEAMSEASPPLTASHRPPTQSNEPAHFLAQAEQHPGFRIVVQGIVPSRLRAAGGGGQVTGFGNGGMRQMTRVSRPRPPRRLTLHKAPDDPIPHPSPAACCLQPAARIQAAKQQLRLHPTPNPNPSPAASSPLPVLQRSRTWHFA